MRQIPTDPSLGDLPALFPTEGAPPHVAAVGGSLLGEKLDPGSGEILYVRYWPAEGCVVLWSFVGSNGRRLVSGRLFVDERRALAGESALERRLQRAQTRNGAPPYRRVGDGKLLLTAYPLDGKLTGLLRATSEEWIREMLCPALDVTPASVGAIDCRPLSYKPWHRCVLHYRLARSRGESSYFAKVFRDERGRTLYERSRAVNEALREAGLDWTTPAACAYLPAERVVVFEALQGAIEVRDLLHDARRSLGARVSLLEALDRSASALGDLQGLELGELPLAPPEELLARLRKRTRGIELVSRPIADLFARELDRLEEEASRLEPEPLVPSHGALRYDQLLLLGDRLAVLDLDGLCLSGRSADAGHLLGFLDMVALRRPRQREVLRACEEVFLRGLGRHGMGATPWLGWYRGLARLKKTMRSFLSIDRKWVDSVTALERGRIGIDVEPEGSG